MDGILVRVLIAEDDKVVGFYIQSVLTSIPNVEVIGMATNGKDALAIAQEFSPDVVFLDIELPQIDGLSIAAKLKKIIPQLMFVFVTAHSNYAADSYRLDAVDYLVKPVNQDLLSQAVNKIRQHKKFIEQEKAQKMSLECLLIRNKDQICLIKPADIVFIEKYGRKTIVHTLNNRFETSDSLSKLLDELGPGFLRSHKSCIINPNYVLKIVFAGNRTYDVIFNEYDVKGIMTSSSLKEFYKMIAYKDKG